VVYKKRFGHGLKIEGVKRTGTDGKHLFEMVELRTEKSKKPNVEERDGR